MSIPEPQGAFIAGFMDDYFAEAEEHVVAVRRSLLTLEAAVGSHLPPAVIEELFRSVHSLKGISAMVELREAELLAHQMEGCLRGIGRGWLTITPANFDVLVDGAKALEGVIATHRRGEAIPDIAPILQQLDALALDQRPDAVDSGAPRHAAPWSSPGVPGLPARRWTVTFTPSPELVARGIKVDTIRTRLLQIGDVVNVVPRVIAGGGISFEFDVSTDRETQLAEWRDDGLTFEPVQPTPADLTPDPHTGNTDPSLPAGQRSLDVAATNFVRVDLARLDELVRLTGDMVVVRARLEDTLERVERHIPFQEWRSLQEHSSGMERLLRSLREGVMRVRLVPVGEIFRRTPFVVRDLARDSGKRVQFDIVGHATEIDKFLIERMMDPILHLVRNAVSHAIETPAVRIAAGKPPEGRLQLRASTAGESVILEITDDGSGIDADAVSRRARAAGMSVPDGPLDARALLDIICASGFSTRDEADRASGRGVGMAVVRTAVEGLGGTLSVSTEVGRGTAFEITLPLTLAITDAIIVHVGDQTFAVPQAAVREVIEIDAASLRSIERNELVTYRSSTLPIVRLARLFNIAVESRARLHAIVVGVGLAAVGLLVDRIGGQREVVVKTINDPLIRVEGVSGATELGDGRLVLILDVLALCRTLRARTPRAGGPSA